MRYVVELPEALSLNPQSTQQLSQALNLKPDQVQLLAQRTPGVISKPLSPENAQRLAQHLQRFKLPVRIRSEDGHYIDHPDAGSDVSKAEVASQTASAQTTSTEALPSSRGPESQRASVSVMTAQTSSQAAVSTSVQTLVNSSGQDRTPTVIRESQHPSARHSRLASDQAIPESKADLELPSGFFVSQAIRSYPQANAQHHQDDAVQPGRLGWFSLVPALFTVVVAAIAVYFSSQTVSQQQTQWTLELNTTAISSILSGFAADLELPAWQDALSLSQPALRQQGIELLLVNNPETREMVGWHGDTPHLLLSTELRGLIQAQVDRARMQAYIAGGHTTTSRIVRSEVEGRPLLLQAQVLQVAEREKVLIVGLADSSPELRRYLRQQSLLPATLPILLTALLLIVWRLRSRS